MSEEKVMPFWSACQFIDWQDINCCKCKKYNVYEEKTCELELSMSLAALTDGEITPEFAERIGYQDGVYVWICSERDLREDEEC